MFCLIPNSYCSLLFCMSIKPYVTFQWKSLNPTYFRGRQGFMQEFLLGGGGGNFVESQKKNVYMKMVKL